MAEVVVVDDGSKDGSLELCLKLRQSNSKIKVFTHKQNKNKGIAASRNLGIKNAISEWIAFLDSDDYYLPERFKSATLLLKEDIYIDGIYSKSSYVDEVAGISSQRGGLRIKVHSSILFETLIKNDYGCFNTPTILVRKKLINKCQGFDERLKMCDDVQMWNKCALLGSLIPDSNEKAVSRVRIHNDNIWSGNKEYSFNYYKSHYLMLYYLIPYVLEFGNNSQKKVFFDQVLMDYRVFYRVLPKKFKRKWYLEVYLLIIKIITSSKIKKQQPDFYKQFKNWCWDILIKELKLKKEVTQANILKIIPRVIKDKLKSINEQ